MANKHMKTCSALLVVREMQIKTMRYYVIPVELLKFKNQQDQMWKRSRVTRSLNALLVGGKVKWCGHFGKPFGNFSVC